MKKFLSLMLLLSTPYLTYSMEEKKEETAPKKESPLLNLEYTGPHTFSQSVDTRSLSHYLVSRESHPHLSEKMAAIVSELHRSTLFKDTLIEYQQALLARKAPWETEDEKIMKRLQDEMKSCKHELAKIDERNTAFSHADATKQFPRSTAIGISREWDNLAGWYYNLAAQKAALTKHVALHFAFTLEKLHELDTQAKTIKTKIDELAARAEKDNQEAAAPSDQPDATYFNS